MPLPRPIKWITSCFPFFFLILLISELCVGLAPAQAQPQVDLTGKNVLVLHAFESNVPIFQLTDRGLREALDAGGVGIGNQFYEYLDLRRNPGPEHKRLMAELMRLRYGHRKIDLIITMYPEALEFVLKDGRDIFPDVPILALHLPQGFELPKTDRNIIGQAASLDIIGTFKIALKLVPGAKRVYVVSGAHQVDRRIEDQARRDLKEWEGRLEFRYLNHLPLEGILATVSNAPAGTIVLILAFTTDVTGRNFTSREVAKRLSQVSTAPIFGLLEVGLGHGIVGGSLINFEHIGTKAGELVLNILRGGLTEEAFPKFLDVPSLPMFDWRQLRHWNLSEAALPRGSIVVNREFTLWDLKYYIIGILALGAVQWFLIARLLAQRRRRTKAEKSLKERLRFEQLLSDFSAKFLNIAPYEIERETEGALKGIVDFFRVTHCILIKAFPEEQRAVIVHAAHADDVPPTQIEGNLYSVFPWVSKMVAQGTIMRVSTLDDLPVEAAADKETYQNLGVRSILVIPLFIEGSPGYAISISTRREERLWPEEFIPRLELLGKILINSVERKRAEQSLRQKTEELDQFFNVTVDVLCIASTDGYFLRLNPAAERILGYTREELVAKRFLEFVHPDDLDRTREAVSTLVSQQKVFSFENRYRCKDGTYRWLQWSSAPAGKLIYGAARDITERKRAEEEAVQHVKNIEYLSETAMGFVELPAEKDIYWFIGEKLRQLTGDAVYVSVNAYDQKTRRIEARALLADDQDLRGILETLGTDLRGMSFSLNEEAWNGLISGKLVRVPGGIYELFFGELPKAACDALEKLAGIGEIFAMGFARKGELYGNAIIIMREGSQLSGKDLIEAFLRQAGVALQRKLADEELKKSEERFRMLIETMNEGFGVQNENGIWTYANDQLCWMLGHLPGEVIGHPVTEFLDEANQSVLREEIQKQREGNYSPYEMTWTRIDGRKVTTKVSPKAIFNPEGQLKEAFAVITDITERKQGEEILKQSEERFRQVAENVGDFIWEVDTNGLYLYTSPSVEKILGYRPDELVGKRHFYDLFAPEVREELKAAAFKVFAAKGSFRALPNSNIGKEGKVVHLETSGAPVVDAAGNLVGYRGADTDVTERKRTEEELRRHQEHLEELVRERTTELIMARDQAEDANRAKSTFLANMSHELRTPLNSILGIAQLMERDSGFPGGHRETLKILSRSGAHLLELINDVLELSKIEAGKMAPVLMSFDLHSFLGDLEEMIRLWADQKGLKLLFEHKPPLPRYIETDVRKLRQILVNLLSNAIKYTERGGVTLRIAFKEGMDTTAVAKPASMARLEFEIEDTGIGIAPEDTQRIFEPFVQVNPGRSARDGTGLGLTLSRMFAELLGGEITIRSQVGRGSIFTFDIPAKLAEGAAIHTEVSDRQVIGLIPGQSPYLLLVVDDSVANRFVLRRLLEQGGFSVLEAASGQEAIDLFKDRQPHLIWMDLRMPGMDGDEAARRIREAENGRREEKGKEIHTPIIALTAGVMGNKGPPSHSQVFDDWVYKPYRETEIFAKLEKHLGVQFVYRPSVGSVAEADKGREKDALTPADLAVLPVEWLQKFFQTLRRGGSEELLNLIDRIRSEHADLARVLTELVHIYRFDKLIAVTGEVLKENSNG